MSLSTIIKKTGIATCLLAAVGLSGCSTITNKWIDNYGKDTIESMIDDYREKKASEDYDTLDQMVEAVYPLVTYTTLVDENQPEDSKHKYKERVKIGLSFAIDGDYVLSLASVTERKGFKTSYFDQKTDEFVNLDYKVLKEETYLITKNDEKILLKPINEDLESQVAIFKSPKDLNHMPAVLGTSEDLVVGQEAYMIIGGKYPYIRDGEITALNGTPRISYIIEKEKCFMAKLFFDFGNEGAPVVTKHDGKWKIVGLGYIADFDNLAFSYALKMDKHKDQYDLIKNK